MTEQLTFDHDGNVIEMFDALVKESELYEQPSSVDPNAPDTIRNAWRKAKQDRIKEFKKKQDLSYDEKLERVHIEIPYGYVGMVKSKSGLMLEGIVTDGTVDSGYTGSIRVVLFNHSKHSRDFKAGEKIAQLVIMKIVSPAFEQVEKVNGGDRGNSGFGSTGR